MRCAGLSEKLRANSDVRAAWAKALDESSVS